MKTFGVVFGTKQVFSDGSSDHDDFSGQYPFPFFPLAYFLLKAPTPWPFRILASLDIVITLCALFSTILLS